MADTLTSNYNWVKPDPGGDANTWGVTLNATTDKIDAQVFTNSQGVVPIGSGALWFTNTPPTNWLLCQGQSLSTSGTYAALFAVIGTQFNQSGDPAGTFRLPNFANVFPMGAGTLGAIGGEASHILTLGEMAWHAHAGTYQDAHTHPGSYQDGHVHGASQPAHTHYDSGHGHSASGSDSGHTHSYTTSAAGPGSAGGTTFTATAGATTGTGYANISVSIAAGYASLNSAQPSITIDNRQPALHIDTQQPAVHVGAEGGNAGHNNLPPFLQINFIIKYA